MNNYKKRIMAQGEKNPFFLIALCITLLSLHATTAHGIDVFTQDSLKSDTLTEVIVNSQYRYARRQGDKYVVSFKGSSFYKDKTLYEDLSFCPLLARKGDDFSILGKESTVIYVDGRPTSLTGEDLAAFLNSNSTKDIERIEIITNSSMRYPVSNKSGIINIIMATPGALGFMSTLSEKLVRGKKWGGQTSGIFGVNFKNLNVNLFANYAHLSKLRSSESTYHFADGEGGTEMSDFKQVGQPLTTMLSAEWRLKKNVFGVAYTFASLHVDEDADNTTVEDEMIQRQSVTNNKNHTLQVYDDFSIGKSSISVLYNYYYRKNKINNWYIAEDNVRQYDHDDYKLNNLKIDVETKVSDAWIMQYGINGNLINMSSDYAFSTIHNVANYKERNMDVYVATSLNVHNVNVSGGLKYEYSNQNYVGNKKVYNYFVPNIMVTWQSGWGQIFGGYSREIEKVPYTNLSISPVYFSPQSFEIGNPDLRPETLHYVNLGVSKGNLNVELFYKRYSNSSLMYSTRDDDNIVNTYVNLKNEDQCGLNLSYMKSWSTWLLAKLTWSTYWDYAKISDTESQKSWNNFLSAGMMIKFDKKGRLDMNVDYWALLPQKEHGVYWKYRGNLTAGINYNIVKDKLRATLNFSDILNQDIAKTRHTYQNVSTYNRSTFDNKKISLTIRYTFSNKRSAKHNMRKDIDEEDRIPVE